MELPDIKIENYCSDDIFRFSMAHVYFDGEYLWATDGHILARYKPSLGTVDTPYKGFIAREAFIEARKKKATALVICEDGVELRMESYTTKFKIPTHDTPVNFDAVLKEALDLVTEDAPQVCLHVLQQATKTLGNLWGSLQFSHNPLKPTILTAKGYHRDDFVGLVMPERKA